MTRTISPSDGCGFTPGPWAVSLANTNNFTICKAGTDLTARGGRVAYTAISQLSSMHDEGLANARLIAAAPDMFEAVRLFVEEYDAFDQNDGVAMMLAYNRALEAGRAALAKARGE